MNNNCIDADMALFAGLKFGWNWLENTAPAELLWGENTVLTEKRSRTSWIWGKPNRAYASVVWILCQLFRWCSMMILRCSRSIYVMFYNVFCDVHVHTTVAWICVCCSGDVRWCSHSVHVILYNVFYDIRIVLWLSLKKSLYLRPWTDPQGTLGGPPHTLASRCKWTRI